MRHVLVEAPLKEVVPMVFPLPIPLSSPPGPRVAGVASAPAAPLAVGVDIAKATFVAAVWIQAPGQVLGTFANTTEGFTQLAQQLHPLLPAGTPPHLVLEPTGGYEIALLAFALEQGWRVSRPNPTLVRDWSRGLGQRAKTDRQDARQLARYGAERQPPLYRPLASEVSELESLQRRKEDLEQLLRQERNRAQHVSGRPGIAGAVPQSVERVVQVLEEELRGIEQAIAEHLRQHAQLQAARALLLPLPGVGPATVVPLLLGLERWNTLTDGQGDADGLVAYLGLDPQPYQSGTSVHRRATISRKGSRTLRHQLFMGVLGGVRGHNPLRAFYDRLVARGKAKKVALIAAMRKLVVWAWAVYRTRQPFDPTKLTHLTSPSS